MVDPNDLRIIIAEGREWLLVRETGRTFPLQTGEIEIDENGGKTRLGFLDDHGFHWWRLNDFSQEGGEIVIDVAGAFSRGRESMRLVPRAAAAELTADIELARLTKANEIVALIAANFPGVKLGRVALNEANGRLAQIEFETADKTPTAAIADVTSTMTVEAIFTAAILRLEKLALRKKKPLSDIWIICEKRSARNARKLHALLTPYWKNKITVVEIDPRSEPTRLTLLSMRKIGDLWREKPKKLVLPEPLSPSEIAQQIIELSPDKIDIVRSKQGETLRFLGLPFARVRTIMGTEKAWFGIGRERRILRDDNFDDLATLVGLLEQNRSFDASNKRHDYYRASPEAWLESILRRNIKLLDANLVLSPIYNQFRSSSDKIDLLALRKDGRLVIIELKTQPDREMVFQAVDYWRKIELQRRRGILSAADLFGGREIIDKPALVYLTAPAWSFHPTHEFFTRAVTPGIELWRFELHENWRFSIHIVGRLGCGL